MRTATLCNHFADIAYKALYTARLKIKAAFEVLQILAQFQSGCKDKRSALKNHNFFLVQLDWYL